MRLNARFGSRESAKLVPVRTFVRSSLDSSAQSTARRRFARIIVASALINATKGRAGNEQGRGCVLRAPVTRVAPGVFRGGRPDRRRSARDAPHVAAAP